MLLFRFPGQSTPFWEGEKTGGKIYVPQSQHFRKPCRWLLQTPLKKMKTVLMKRKSSYMSDLCNGRAFQCVLSWTSCFLDMNFVLREVGGISMKMFPYNQRKISHQSNLPSLRGSWISPESKQSGGSKIRLQLYCIFTHLSSVLSSLTDWNNLLQTFIWAS